MDAELLEGVAPADLDVVESEWAPERSRILQVLIRDSVPNDHRPQSLHWNWRAKAHHLKLLHASGFGVVCEQRWQGVMLTKSATYFAHLGDDRGKPIVYIDYLEIAPWNWTIPEIAQAGKFGMIGQQLFWSAVKQSQDEGFHGRVGLHALPQAEWFYSDVCKMTPLGRESEKEGLMYFELSREQAKTLLQRKN